MSRPSQKTIERIAPIIPVRPDILRFPDKFWRKRRSALGCFGLDAVLPLCSLNPVSFLNRTFQSVTTGPPFPTEQPLAVRPQLSRGFHVAIQRLPLVREPVAHSASLAQAHRGLLH